MVGTGIPDSREIQRIVERASADDSDTGTTPPSQPSGRHGIGMPSSARVQEIIDQQQAEGDDQAPESDSDDDVVRQDFRDGRGGTRSMGMPGGREVDRIVERVDDQVREEERERIARHHDDIEPDEIILAGRELVPFWRTDELEEFHGRDLEVVETEDGVMAQPTEDATRRRGVEMFESEGDEFDEDDLEVVDIDGETFVRPTREAQEELLRAQIEDEHPGARDIEIFEEDGEIRAEFRVPTGEEAFWDDPMGRIREVLRIDDAEPTEGPRIPDPGVGGAVERGIREETVDGIREVLRIDDAEPTEGPHIPDPGVGGAVERDVPDLDPRQIATEEAIGRIDQAEDIGRGILEEWRDPADPSEAHIPSPGVGPDRDLRDIDAAVSGVVEEWRSPADPTDSRVPDPGVGAAASDRDIEDISRFDPRQIDAVDDFASDPVGVLADVHRHDIERARGVRDSISEIFETGDIDADDVSDMHIPDPGVGAARDIDLEDVDRDTALTAAGFIPITAGPARGIQAGRTGREIIRQREAIAAGGAAILAGAGAVAQDTEVIDRTESEVEREIRQEIEAVQLAEIAVPEDTRIGIHTPEIEVDETTVDHVEEEIAVPEGAGHIIHEGEIDVEETVIEEADPEVAVPEETRTIIHGPEIPLDDFDIVAIDPTAIHPSPVQRLRQRAEEEEEVDEDPIIITGEDLVDPDEIRQRELEEMLEQVREMLEDEGLDEEEFEDLEERRRRLLEELRERQDEAEEMELPGLVLWTPEPTEDAEEAADDVDGFAQFQPDLTHAEFDVGFGVETTAATAEEVSGAVAAAQLEQIAAEEEDELEAAAEHLTPALEMAATTELLPAQIPAAVMTPTTVEQTMLEMPALVADPIVETLPRRHRPVRGPDDFPRDLEDELEDTLFDEARIERELPDPGLFDLGDFEGDLDSELDRFNDFG